MNVQYLLCKNCNALLERTAEKEYLFCPYCGANVLVEENDPVKIQQIKSQENLDILKERASAALEMEKLRMEQKKRNNKIVIIGLLLMFALIAFCAIMSKTA